MCKGEMGLKDYFGIVVIPQRSLAKPPVGTNKLYKTKLTVYSGVAFSLMVGHYYSLVESPHLTISYS